MGLPPGRGLCNFPEEAVLVSRGQFSREEGSCELPVDTHTTAGGSGASLVKGIWVRHTLLMANYPMECSDLLVSHIKFTPFMILWSQAWGIL